MSREVRDDAQQALRYALSFEFIGLVTLGNAGQGGSQVNTVF